MARFPWFNDDDIHIYIFTRVFFDKNTLNYCGQIKAFISVWAKEVLKILFGVKGVKIKVSRLLKGALRRM